MVRLSRAPGAPRGGLGDALTFLTRVPIPRRGDAGPPSLGATVPWFPVAGAAIGCVVGGIGAGSWHLVPPAVAAAVAVLGGVLITGAFHEDGLADVADAFVGGWTIDDRMRIMKDPLHGSYGVAALCGSIVVRVVALASVASAGPLALFAVAVATHALARAGAVGLMLTGRVAGPAGPDGLGAGYVRDLRRAPVIAGIAVAAVAAVAVAGWWAGPLAVAAVAGVVVVGWWARRRIGGITGDVLGAAEQVAECLCLVVASGIATRWALW